jgi:FtsH-binding integral membrane protein
MSFENSEQSESQKFGLFIFDCFMSVMYLVLSVILLFTAFFKIWLADGIRIGLGVIFGLYGIYRVIRATKRIIQRNR